MLHSVPAAIATVNVCSAGAGDGLARLLRRLTPRTAAGMLAVLVCVLVIIYGLNGLPLEARLSLTVFVGTLIAWVVLGLPETPVALAGALILVISGAVDEKALFVTLGSEIVWLLIAAFVMASVLRKSGAIERLTAAVLTRCRTVAGVFWGATLAIALTAFIIPSTSARAAILVPVFLGLARAIGRPSVTRGLALLFPSVILLSACASLTGAGAHLIAADFMRRVGGMDIDFARWALLGAPFAFITSFIACGLIQHLFLDAEDRKARVGLLSLRPPAIKSREAAVLGIVGVTVLLWATSALHEQSIAVIALAAALLAASERVSGISFKNALKGVEWNLVLFLAATLLIGESLLNSGAARYLVEQTLVTLKGGLSTAPWMAAAIAALLSSLAHIMITSRTARASVLIPAVALPLAAFGADPSALIFVATVGSGFSQTLMVSSKPVVLFASVDSATFTQSDLFRLSALLLPLFLALLIAFSVYVWPLLGLPLEAVPLMPAKA